MPCPGPQSQQGVLGAGTAPGGGETSAERPPTGRVSAGCPLLLAGQHWADGVRRAHGLAGHGRGPQVRCGSVAGSHGGGRGCGQEALQTSHLSPSAVGQGAGPEPHCSSGTWAVVPALRAWEWGLHLPPP